MGQDTHSPAQGESRKLAAIMFTTVVSLGRPKLKNIVQRFPVYALLPENPKGLRQTLRLQRLKLSRRVRPAYQVVATGLVLVAATIVAVRYFSRPLFNIQDSAPRTEAAPVALPLPDKPSIAVLPFTNMSGDPEQEYFSDGMTEVLTSDLSKLSGLFVIARNSAFTYKGKAVKVQDVSRELGVRYVLEGSVLKSGDQVRITAQLIDATTGYHLWTERYDRPLRDIFALQDDIVQKIVTTLKLQLTLWEQGILVRKTTDNLEAYDSYLRGSESLWRFTKEANTQARPMFEKAIELDPQYAQAYAALSMSYWMAWSSQWSSDPQTLERALPLAQKAVEIDDSLPGVHSVLAWTYLWKKQVDQGIVEAERAIALDPNCDSCYVALGACMNGAGRPEEAIRLIEKAMRLNPRYPHYYAGTLGLAYLLALREEEAIVPLKQALSRNPHNLFAHLGLAAAYGHLEREEEARAAVAEVLRISPNFSLEVARQTFVFKDPAVLVLCQREVEG